MVPCLVSSFPMTFRFALVLFACVVTAVCADRPTVLFMVGEHEYGTKETLPKFAKQLNKLGVDSVFVQAKSDDRNSLECHEFPGFEKALKKADLLFLSVRRRYPTPSAMNAIRDWVKAGKPVMGIRTSSHPFASRPKGKGYQPPKGHVEWLEFDREVLGAEYTGHYGADDGECLAAIESKNAAHAILKGIKLPKKPEIPSHLYRSEVVDAKNVKVLMNGVIKARKVSEPIAWIRTPGTQRIFYTSVGGVEDMALPWVRHMLGNAVFWALNEKRPATSAGIIGAWKLAVDDPEGTTHHPRITLRMDKGKLKGTYTAASDNQDYDALKLRFADNQLFFTAESFTWTVSYKLKVTGPQMKGTMNYDIAGFTGKTDIKGTRVQ